MSCLDQKFGTVSSLLSGKMVQPGVGHIIIKYGISKNIFDPDPKVKKMRYFWKNM
jgi:hypothetical protein